MKSDKCISYLNKKNTLITNHIFDRPNKMLKFYCLKVKLIMNKNVQGSFKTSDLRAHMYTVVFKMIIMHEFESYH